MRAKALTGLLGFAAVACGGASQRYTVIERSDHERELPPVHARVVSAAHAARSGLSERPLVVNFDRGSDDGTLVGTFLRRADARGARLVTDVVLVERELQEGRRVECRRAIVPEDVIEETQHAATARRVSTRKPVTRFVTEKEYRCKTVFSFEYAQPITRNECTWENVSKLVTEDEWVSAIEEVPARTDVRRRQRLHVLDPQCSPVDTGHAPPRIEARIFVPVTASI
jgi:hypothetical protein